MAHNNLYDKRYDKKLLELNIPIWEREKPSRCWDPGPRLIKSIRQYQRFKKSKNPFNSVIRSKLCVMKHRFWSMVTGAEISQSCQFEGGLLIPHPNGIVIHPDSTIGCNCVIFQQASLIGSVEVGYHVEIGAGAKVIGPLKIGNHARIGANAVVTHDVAERDTVAGVPARSIRSK